VGDSILAAWALIDDRLDELRACMTDEPVEVVAARYGSWKRATTAALEGIAVEPVVRRFEAVQGYADRRDGHRPTPQLYLDAAAARAFLVGLKQELTVDPAAVLRRPPEAPIPPDELRLRTIVRLLERRLPGAFREQPVTREDLANGFETLLAGAGIAYERRRDAAAADFAFPTLRTALALKLCDTPGREKELVAEIEAEIPARRAAYPRMIFGVFDLGFISNAEAFARTFDGHEGVRVVVMTAAS